jgi:aspartyl/asparaginyl beta-hydroxylase (cupin superfamily)
MIVNALTVLLDKDLFNKIDMTRLASFYKVEQFPYLNEIEDKFALIYAEWLAVSNTNTNIYQVWPQYQLSSGINSWTAIPLVAPNVHSHQNVGGLLLHADLFPITSNILRTALGDRLDTVMFSKVKAHSKISPHKGRFSNTLRCHLGIDIPAGECKIKVSSEISGWETGKLLVLDDRLEHEVWNLTDNDRTVLIFDFIPDNILNFFPY